MEILDSVMVVVPWKVVWKSASMIYGGQYAIIVGITLMQELFADNWDIPHQVRLEFTSLHISCIIILL